MVVFPAASLAETITLYGPCWAKVDTTVPLIKPVVTLIPRPGGKPVAPKVTAVSLGSSAWIGRLTGSPSVLSWGPGLVISGGRRVGDLKRHGRDIAAVQAIVAVERETVGTRIIQVRRVSERPVAVEGQSSVGGKLVHDGLDRLQARVARAGKNAASCVHRQRDVQARAVGVADDKRGGVVHNPGESHRGGVSGSITCRDHHAVRTVLGKGRHHRAADQARWSR